MEDKVKKENDFSNDNEILEIIEQATKELIPESNKGNQNEIYD